MRQPAVVARVCRMHWLPYSAFCPTTLCISSSCRSFFPSLRHRLLQLTCIQWPSFPPKLVTPSLGWLGSRSLGYTSRRDFLEKCRSQASTTGDDRLKKPWNPTLSTTKPRHLRIACFALRSFCTAHAADQTRHIPKQPSILTGLCRCLRGTNDGP